ncbi:MAG: peptidylprolyl isomerase [Marvinbryantia sp.]|jgi:foldase protein PrsA
MNRFGKKFLTAGMCAALAMTALTGCASAPNMDDVAATMDGKDITLGEAYFLFRYQQATNEMYLGSLFGDQNMWEQDLTGSGIAYGVTFKEQIMEGLKNMLIAEQHMADYEVEVTEEEKTAITEAAAQFLADNEDEAMKAMGADQEAVERVLTLYTIQNKMRDAIIADADTEVSDEEAAQKAVSFAYFSTAGETDEEGNKTELTEEEKAEVKKQAEEVIAAVQGGETLEDAVKAVDEEMKVSNTTYGKEDTTLNEGIRDAADKLKEGEVAAEPVEASSGYYVVQLTSEFDKEATEEKKEEIVSQRQSDLYTEVMEGWEPESFEINHEVWDKVAFDVKFTAPEAETETGSEVGSEAVSEKTSEVASEAASETTTEETTTEAVSETEADTETETASETETETETK